MPLENFTLSFLVLIPAFFLLSFGYLHFSDKEDVLNNFLSFGALFFVLIQVLILYLLMYQHPFLRTYALNNFIFALTLPIFMIALIVLISTVLVNLYRKIFKSKDFTPLQEKWDKKIENLSKIRRDTYRKISHVLIFVGLVVVWIIGYSVVFNSIKAWVGMIPDETNTLALYLNIINEPNSIRYGLYSMGWFYYLIFFFFYAFCLFLLVNEITRKTRNVAFPFNLLPQLVMSEKEKQSYGTYLYFAIGQMFAAFLTPPMIFFSILGISSLADLMKSQVRIRKGKHHIKWNQDKTWEGTIAGVVTSLILCYIFVGLIWSIIFTLAFLIFDVITSKPFDVSDNLLIPIGCALIYISVRFFFDLNYISPILQLF